MCHCCNPTYLHRLDQLASLEQRHGKDEEKEGKEGEEKKLGEGEGEGDEENEELENEEEFGDDDYAQKVPHTEKVQDVKHTKTGPKHLLSSASIERFFYLQR